MNRKLRVIVTGGSRGIGNAIATELALKGAQLLLVARDKAKLKNAADEICGKGAECVHICSADLRMSGAANKIYKYAEQIGFKPNVLVLCAGTFFEEDLAAATRQHIEEQIKVNLVSYIEISQCFFGALRSSEYARIILIGSTAGYEPYSYGPIYGITKWALRGLAENMRSELRASKVGVTLVNPGGTWTDLWSGVSLPRERLLEPRDIAILVATSLSLSNQAVVDELTVRPIEGDMHD